jgi:hypothetical protein
VNFVELLRATVVFEPLTGSVPAQPPDATQLFALVDDHVKVDVDPLLSVVGVAARVTEGAGAVTDTVMPWVATPPGPEHVRK